MGNWARRWIPLVGLALVGCGAAGPSGTTTPSASAIEAVLDDWHRAAAEGDHGRYFGHMTEDAVFLGTDATERWTKPEFAEYSREPFADGHGWTMRADRRDVIVSRRGDLAWFDEDLVTENLGPARGSGVLRRGPDGVWRIAHYNLTITVPNERFREVRALLDGPGDDDG